MQHVIVLARNRPPRKPGALSQCRHPGVRGLSAPRLLRLSRLLGPRYAFATNAIVSSLTRRTPALATRSASWDSAARAFRCALAWVSRSSRYMERSMSRHSPSASGLSRPWREITEPSRKRGLSRRSRPNVRGPLHSTAIWALGVRKRLRQSTSRRGVASAAFGTIAGMVRCLSALDGRPGGAGPGGALNEGSTAETAALTFAVRRAVKTTALVITRQRISLR